MDSGGVRSRSIGLPETGASADAVSVCVFFCCEELDGISLSTGCLLVEHVIQSVEQNLDLYN